MTTDLEQRLREALHEDAARAHLFNPDGPPALEVRPLSDGQHPRRSMRKLVAIAAAITLIVAAGVTVIQNRDRDPELSTHAGLPGDQAIADGAVLTPEDMPVGWVAAPPADEQKRQADEDDFDQAFADCVGVEVSEPQNDGPTADSAFVNSSQVNDERIVSEVTVFASETDAQHVLDRFRDDAAPGCYRDVIEEQIAEAARDSLTTISGTALSTDDIQIGESTIEELSLESLDGGSYQAVGDDHVAFRAKVPLSSEGVEADVYADFALVRKGRVVVQTSFQTYFTTFDSGVSLTRKVVDRIPADVVDQPMEPVEQVDERPPLPEPGEQPADPTAAEEEVRAAFMGAFDFSKTGEEMAQFSERSEVFAAANRVLRASQFGPAIEGSYAQVDSVVFTSPTHAVVQFQTIASDPIVPRYHTGDAVLLDGRWRVAITTSCRMLEVASIECDMTL